MEVGRALSLQHLIVGPGLLTLFLISGCERQPLQLSDTQVRANLNALRAWPGSPLPAGAARFRAVDTSLVPDFDDSNESVSARAALPGKANGKTHIEDRQTGLGIDISLVGANATAAHVVDGYVVYPRGHALGWVYQRADQSGIEDYLVLDARPVSPSVAYQVKLGPRVAGLRLVQNQLEVLDASGAPRLRLTPPYVMGNNGVRTDALLAVEGCAVDTDPAGPWGRPVRRSGPNSCRIIVSWANDRVSYPALLDPRWQTTGSLSVARQDHNLITLPLTGKVLAVGGRSSPTSTTGLASAELFDNSTRTWSATSPMTGGRWSASATLLGASANGTTSQKVLIAGGINGTASVNTAQLYNQTAGTWGAAGTLNAPRHLHTATLLNDGRVLVCGGMNGSSVLTSAALYNPASGSGSWAATTGPIPPPGWRSGTATLIKTSNNQLNNKVLLAGGNNGTGTISAVFLFDPAQSAFSTLAAMPSPREGHQAVALSDGRILVAGGKNGSTTLASAVIFDPSWGPGSWYATGSMTSPRWGHAMDLLPSGVLTQGLVLVSGGSNGTSTLSSTEYWNGVNWATDGVMVAPVQQHASVALGKSLLVAGGSISNGSTTVSAAEIYDPSIGLGCDSASQCASGFCVAGVCCDSACNSGCGSCNLPGHLGICTSVAAGQVCRPSVGECDVAATCDGGSLACPANALKSQGTTCRESTGICDMAETCTGTSATCPTDRFQPATTECRSSAGDCDTAEYCTEASADCPPDRFQPPTAECRPSTGECDPAESCEGTSAVCPEDRLQPPTAVCRPAVSQCDAAELCSGSSASCPPDELQPSGTACTSETGCTKLDQCDGAGTCTGTPIDKMGCNIHLRVDGVVNMGDGTFRAIFGYDSSASGSVRPATNQLVLTDTGDVLHPNPPPPAYFEPTTHRVGAFLPSFNSGQSIEWQVDGERVSASESSTQYAPVTMGTGQGVDLGNGQIVMLKPDLSSYLTPPTDPGNHKKLPTGDPFVGVISGELSVSPTGAAVYTLPILKAPGLAGMAPNLNLVYNSQGGDGIAGQGWELSGLSVIHRCSKTKVQDGYSQIVNMDSSSLLSANGDGVCLDGKRLFPLADGSFTTEVSDFSSIALSPDEGTFWVTTKSGEVRMYGFKEDARILLPQEDANGNPSPSEKVIAVWALDMVMDQWGNYYKIYYDPDPVNKGVLVTRIEYTGHVNRRTGNQSWNTLPYSINFDYEPRPDVRRVRFRHSVLTKSQRLKSIGTDRGTYTIAYRTDAKPGNPNQHNPLLPSRLKTISYCSKTQPSVCAKDLDFGYENSSETSGYGWMQSEVYKPPVATPDGTAFVDLNADGLVDIVKASKNNVSQPTILSKTWKNTGIKWEPAPNWNLPDGVLLAHVEWTGGDTEIFATIPYGTAFADVDGDGLPDLITDKFTGDVCDGSGRCEHADGQPAVWINHTRDVGGGWVGAPLLSGSNFAKLFADKGLNKLDLTKGKDTFVDFDGDGRAELVRIADGPKGVPAEGWMVGVVYEAHAFRRGENLEWYLTYGGETAEDWSSGNIGHSFSTMGLCMFEEDLSLTDVNRDGLPDIVIKGPLCETTMLNTGKDRAGVAGTIWKTIRLSNQDLKNIEGTGDIDGDGSYDWVIRKEWSLTKVSFMAGFAPVSEAAAGPYGPTLKNYTRNTNWEYKKYGKLAAGEFELVDVNADGLADVVVNHKAAGSQLLLNTGNTWEDLYGWAGYDDFEETPAPDGQAIPGKRPVAIDSTRFHPLEAFLDVNGDGLPDRVQVLEHCAAWVGDKCIASPPQGPNFQMTALNTFVPSRITTFPSGQSLGWQIVDYTTITTAEAADVYSDSNTLTEGTRYYAVPMTVVASIGVPRGEFNEYASTSYQYENIRASAKGRGPQGFGKIKITAPDGIVTTTTYGQAFPYTGMPISVVREKNGLISSTETNFCDNLRPGGDVKNCTSLAGFSEGPLRRNVFIYPLKVTDTNYLRDSDGSPPNDQTKTLVTVTDYVFDEYGNSKLTTVTTTRSDGESYRRRVENDYVAGGIELQKRGKASAVTVTSVKLWPEDDDGNPEVHRFTSFEYGDAPTYALSKKNLLLAAGGPKASVTAFGYDAYGNVATTTECASALDHCDSEAEHPGSPGEPNDPGWRRTRMSYDPADFQLSPGGMTGDVKSLPLPYLPGWYPVKTTNSAGHVEYTAYDPLLGVKIQSTGPNGVQTCYRYDGLGYQTSETARCGAAHELTSTVERYLIPFGSDPLSWVARTLTITKQATGGVTGVYADELGRTVRTFTSSLSADLAYTRTEFDEYGRLKRTSKPSLGDTPRYWTETSYDWLGRVRTVTQDVYEPGDKSSSVTTTYSGWEVQTEQTVNREVRTRTERKNGLGKVAEVEDADRKEGVGNKINYTYDAEGNLRQTKDPGGNIVALTYDTLGRKRSMVDPDLGSWTYEYNGFGELILQTANGKNTTILYDDVGRMTKKTDEQGTAEWIYDKAEGAKYGKLAAMVSAPDPGLKEACQVPHATETTGKRSGRWFAYNEFGDIIRTIECVDGKTFTADFSYDDWGRQKVVTYPEANGLRFAAEYHYTQLGFLQYVADPTDGKPYWVAKASNAAGQISVEQTRNGVETTSDYSDATGWLNKRDVIGKAGGRQISDMAMLTYDQVGNVLTKSRYNREELSDATEVFTYDKLDRLLTSELKIPAQGYDATESYQFDALGNVTLKNGKVYSYTGCYAGPHAVCQVGDGSMYEYDVNGSMTKGNGRSVTYNSSNRPSRILNDESGAAVDFVYGADGHRVVQSLGRKESQAPFKVVESARTQYVGLGATGKSLYERTSSGSTVEHIHFLYAGGAHDGNAFGTYVVKEDVSSSLTSMEFNHFDHLGSIVAMTDEYGQVLGPSAGGADATLLAYDAWGARRNPDGTSATTQTFSLQPGHREYTGHETIPTVGLVNMNGRVYDPDVGRFLTPDPNLQSVGNLQNLNRYSYVLNNPLRYTDPTGYFFLSSTSFWVKAIPVISGAIACLDPVACVAYGVMMTTMYSTAAMLNGAAFDQVMQSAMIGIASSQLGGVAGGLAGSVAGRIVGGAVSSVAASAFSAYMGMGSLGKGMLIAALSGAAAAGITWSLVGCLPVSEASAVEQQGGGGGAVPGKDSLDGTMFAQNDTSGTDIPIEQMGVKELGIFGEGMAGPGTIGLPALGIAGAYAGGMGGAYGGVLLDGLALQAPAVAAAPATRVFWAGGARYAGAAAMRWAAANGALTLEMTLPGRILTGATTLFGYKAMKPLWDLASSRFASSAVGDVHFFMSLSRGVSAASTFLRLELPGLLGNSTVQNVGIHLLQ